MQQFTSQFRYPVKFVAVSPEKFLLLGFYRRGIPGRLTICDTPVHTEGNLCPGCPAILGPA
jgi:hypothetical protein